MVIAAEANLRVRTLCWGGGATSGSQCSENRKCLWKDRLWNHDKDQMSKCWRKSTWRKEKLQGGFWREITRWSKIPSTVPIYLRPMQASPFFRLCNAYLYLLHYGHSRIDTNNVFLCIFFLSPWISLPPFLRRNIKKQLFLWKTDFITNSPFPEIYHISGHISCAMSQEHFNTFS